MCSPATRRNENSAGEPGWTPPGRNRRTLRRATRDRKPSPRSATRCAAARNSHLAPKAPEERRDRIVVPVRDPFLERDDRVVGDADLLRTNFRAALGNVA